MSNKDVYNKSELSFMGKSLPVNAMKAIVKIENDYCRASGQRSFFNHVTSEESVLTQSTSQLNHKSTF